MLLSMVVAAPMAQAPTPADVHSAPLPPPTVAELPPPPPQPTIRDAVEPLAQLIAHGESATAGDYNAANNGYAMDLGKHGLSKFFGRDCSEVTIGEVMLAQDQHRLHAVGRYQIIGTTLASAVRWAGLSGSDMFTPANQDRLFIALIKHKRPAIWSFLSGNGSSYQAANALAREWSSMPAPWGGTYYGHGDRAHVSRSHVVEVLHETREAVATLI